MVYSAWEKWSIYYLGNNLYAPWILDYKQIDQNLLMNRVDRLKHEEQFFIYLILMMEYLNQLLSIFLQ